MKSLPGKFVEPVLVLRKAVAYALDLRADRWDFAIGVNQLEQLGLDENDLRWLTCKGLIDHRREVTSPANEERCFQPAGRLIFSQRSCFVLTDKGATWAQALKERISGHAEASAKPTDLLAAVPNWDVDSRILRLNQVVIKRFRWPAANQEAILCAFQEEGWPRRVFDPLPPRADQASKRRLADTIKCLNRKQAMHLIHFRGDGTGEGVLWECA